MPKGIPYIVGNEAAERFSYYGMLTILQVFMTEHLLTSSGAEVVASRWFEKICRSFQKSMFCVTNAAISGTMPHPLDTTNPEEQEANRAYAASWAARLVIGRTDCLAA